MRAKRHTGRTRQDEATAKYCGLKDWHRWSSHYEYLDGQCQVWAVALRRHFVHESGEKGKEFCPLSVGQNGL